MRDNGTPTDIKTSGGSPVHIADKPCTGCGCYQAFLFECGCGAVHSDVCYNCGGFVDVEHKPIPENGDGWSKRCREGAVPHTHTHELTL
jgi:hypothetical protein